MRDINTVPVEDLTNEELINHARHLDKMLGNDVDDTILELSVRLDKASRLLCEALPSVKMCIRVPQGSLTDLADEINRFIKP